MNEASQPVVHVVDDDESMRSALARLLRAAGYEVRLYASAAEFSRRPPGTGAECALLDVHLPGLTGLDVQQDLASVLDPIPIVFLTGHGDIPMSVHAMKSGAVDFLTKPTDPGAVLEAVARALMNSLQVRQKGEQHRQLREKYDRLTPREREVFAHVVTGQLNKQVAYDLGTAERTIKAHRHNVMEKMEANSVADLVRMAQALGLSDQDS
jgi:FixJ family two-component response regulator